MSFTDIKIKIPGPGNVNDVMHRKRARMVLGDLKKVSWVLQSEEEGWLSLARSGLVEGAARDGGGADGKVIIERFCISLPYVKTFNSKVIKSFVTELRSRECFSCFGIPTLSMYVRYGHYEHFANRYEYVLCIYVMNILCTFHIFISGNVTKLLLIGYRSHRNSMSLTK